MKINGKLPMSKVVFVIQPYFFLLYLNQFLNGLQEKFLSPRRNSPRNFPSMYGSRSVRRREGSARLLNNFLINLLTTTAIYILVSQTQRFNPQQPLLLFFKSSKKFPRKFPLYVWVPGCETPRRLGPVS